jgi:UDP-N-acetylglucosamine 1-carboxyvinyltransferase
MSHLIVHGGTPCRAASPRRPTRTPCCRSCAPPCSRYEPVRLLGVPEITDVRKILEIFRSSAATCTSTTQPARWTAPPRQPCSMPQLHRLPEEMRSSIMLVPPLLARFGVARSKTTSRAARWACARSIRTWKCSSASAAWSSAPRGSLLVRSTGALRATDHWLDYASVTTTENFVLCAALADGTSTLMNAAASRTCRSSAASWPCWACASRAWAPRA